MHGIYVVGILLTRSNKHIKHSLSKTPRIPVYHYWQLNPLCTSQILVLN